jgi:hypothetical protein
MQSGAGGRVLQCKARWTCSLRRRTRGFAQRGRLELLSRRGISVCVTNSATSETLVKH